MSEQYPQPISVTTRVVGFSRAEWYDVRLAARSLEAKGALCGTVIFPDRPELYRLERRGHRRYELRLSSEKEVAETLAEEARGSAVDARKGSADTEEKRADCVGP